MTPVYDDPSFVRKPARLATKIAAPDVAVPAASVGPLSAEDQGE